MSLGDPQIHVFALLARIADELDLPMSTFFEKPKCNPPSEIELRELVTLFLHIDDPLLQGQLISLFRSLGATRRTADRSAQRA